MENGKDINEVLNMPYHFLIDLLKEKSTSEHKARSLIAAFGG
ncbi:phage tail assembly chaperone GT [Rossellomorea aquimaris]